MSAGLEKENYEGRRVKGPMGAQGTMRLCLKYTRSQPEGEGIPTGQMEGNFSVRTSQRFNQTVNLIVKQVPQCPQ